jgi:hypothetical protein
MKLSKFKAKIFGAAVFAGMAFLPVASHAALINDMLNVGINTIQDSDAERVVDSEGNVLSSGQYAIGDAIQAVIRFDTVNAVTIGDAHPAPYQLTGVAYLPITSITVLNDMGDANPANDVIQVGFGNLGHTSAVFERLAGDPAFSLADDPNTAWNNILNQTFVSYLGLGQADDFWTATTVNDISTIALATGSGQVAAGVFGLSQMSGNLPLVPDGILSPVDGNLHDIIGDASVYGRETGVNSGWQVSSNINASFTVPEPGTLALLGLGLMGIGASSLRRRRKA